ncbi:sensor histidine kinase [Actinorugispora endophytica]|uniref:histidine kinase n=1 Tax=Actinorugispora endophytica TaxID=1605990 RepID=A0A4R6VA56_9ACTN|nr:nitrate- and nitrite sensing domain-containing protein [Actinorugispora endophytica]TDQ53426.1 signal transduction histidine kinase [Actinorugispora endophytica]
MTKEQRHSIRARLLALALIPSSALLALWIAITSVLGNDILVLRQGASFTEDVGVPVLEIISDLQAERRSTMEYIADDDDPAARSEMERSRARTDVTAGAFTARFGEAELSDLPRQTRDRVERFTTTLEILPLHRASLDSAIPIRSGGAAAYDEAVEAGLRLWDVQEKLVAPDQAHQARSLTSLFRARELLAQEDALLAYSTVAGAFSITDHIDFTHAVGAQRYLYDQIAPELGDAELAVYEEATESTFFRTVRAMENDVVSSGATDTGIPIDGDAWEAAKESLDLAFQEVEENRTAAILDQSRASVTELRLGVTAISALALAVVVGSMVFTSRVVRGLDRRLGALREATLDYAHTRLPSVTARLRAGERVDVDTAAPPIPVSVRDEIGQVAEAFNIAQRAAVDSAAQEARLREGVRNVFRNIARRAQTLVHRQLSLLDTLEQSETDPAALESLFRIDHLSTQMRRNAENLMLLTDDRPARRAGEPLTLAHAVRAASSEIEDYSRVKLLPMPDTRITGQASGDTVRLLAELLENATAFSAPTTTVTVRGEALAHGHYSLEIEDRGLGMPAENYAEANELLTGSSPRFSLADMREDSQLGLIVVATIARRHGFTVTLRPSPYNGTQAIVVLPPEAVSTEPVPAVAPAPAVRAELEAPVPAEPAPSHTAPAGPASTYKGLPRRRRSRGQGRPEPVSPAPPPPEPAASDRPLEEIRHMMSAFQQGSRHGRAEDSSDHENTEAR